MARAAAALAITEQQPLVVLGASARDARDLPPLVVVVARVGQRVGSWPRPHLRVGGGSQVCGDLLRVRARARMRVRVRVRVRVRARVRAWVRVGVRVRVRVMCHSLCVVCT